MQLIESWKGGQDVHDQIHDQLIEMGYPTVAEYYFARPDRLGVGPAASVYGHSSRFYLPS